MITAEDIEHEANATSNERGEPALHFLATFHAVAEERSFTRAALRLHLSQPAVSAHIQALERHYGVRLFERRNRKVYLSAEGKTLSGYTGRVFHLIKEGYQAVEAVHHGRQGLLRFGASTTFGNYLLPPMLREYALVSPDVDVEVRIGTSSDILAWVLSEEVPFGVVEAPVSHRDVETLPLGSDEVILVVPPDHPLVAHHELEATLLAHEPLLRREQGSATQQLVDRILEQRGLRPRTRMALGSTEALKQAVLASMGVAWLPRAAVSHELATGALVEVKVAGIRISRSLSLLRHQSVVLSGAAVDMLSHIQRALETDAPFKPENKPLTTRPNPVNTY